MGVVLLFYRYRTGEWFFNTGSKKEEREGVLPEKEEGRVGNNRKKLAHYQPASSSGLLTASLHSAQARQELAKLLDWVTELLATRHRFFSISAHLAHQRRRERS